MTRQKTMGRRGGNRSIHQASYAELKAESLRKFYANYQRPGDFALVRASNLIKRFTEYPFKDLAETNLLLKAKAFLAGAK